MCHCLPVNDSARISFLKYSDFDKPYSKAFFVSIAFSSGSKVKRNCSVRTLSFSAIYYFSFQNFLTVRKLQNCSSVVLVLLCRLWDSHFAVLQNGTGGGIRGRCPSATANKWENDTSGYIFPLLANNVLLWIFRVEYCVKL